MNNRIKLAKQIHQAAKDKGWWDTERNKDEMFALIVTELAEAIEAHRKDVNAKKDIFIRKTTEEPPSDWKLAFEGYIKDSIEDELADAFIRCLDYLYWRHNEYMIIPKLSDPPFEDNFAENIFFIMKQVCDRRIADAAVYIEILATHLNTDLEWHVKQKMKYNNLRSYKHGNKKY